MEQPINDEEERKTGNTETTKKLPRLRPIIQNLLQRNVPPVVVLTSFTDGNIKDEKIKVTDFTSLWLCWLHFPIRNRCVRSKNVRCEELEMLTCSRGAQFRNTMERCLEFPSWCTKWLEKHWLGVTHRMVYRDVRREAFGTVTKISRHVKARFLSNLHLKNTLIPSANNHTYSNLLKFKVERSEMIQGQRLWRNWFSLERLFSGLYVAYLEGEGLISVMSGPELLEGLTRKLEHARAVHSNSLSLKLFQVRIVIFNKKHWRSNLP